MIFLKQRTIVMIAGQKTWPIRLAWIVRNALFTVPRNSILIYREYGNVEEIGKRVFEELGMKTEAHPSIASMLECCPSMLFCFCKNVWDPPPEEVKGCHHRRVPYFIANKLGQTRFELFGGEFPNAIEDKERDKNEEYQYRKDRK